MTVIIDLKEIENVAIQDQFDFVIGITSRRIIVQVLDKFFVEIEFLKRIELAVFKTRPTPRCKSLTTNLIFF